MAGLSLRLLGATAVSAVAAGALVVSTVVGETEHRESSNDGSSTPSTRAVALPPSKTSEHRPVSRSSAAPDEPMDAPRAWTRQDPSVHAPPEELVADAAPDADADSVLRVVTVVNKGKRPTVVVEKVRGAGRAARLVGEAQDVEGVLAVSVDTRVRLDAAPTAAGPDTLRTKQWALDRLEAERVWSDYSSGDGSVVAVVDTGVDGSHRDLAGRFTAAGVDYVDGSGDGRRDPHGHGTHVAGVIAAVRGNAIGVSGLAPLARIMPVRALDARGAGWNSNIARGVVYAADHGADVVNLSLGGPDEDPSVKVAVNYAMSQGVLVVAAAGNERATGNATNYPAAYPGVTAVAATERGDTSSTFSNTGAYIDIAAPGGSILSTVPGGYAYLSGTSMATPYVAAAGALVADLTSGAVTTEQFERLLTGTAWDLGAPAWDPEFGYGLVNPYLLLCSLSTCAATGTPTPTPSPTAGSTAPFTPAPAPAPSPTATITSAPSPSPTGTSPSSTPEASPTAASSTTTTTTEPVAAKRRLRLAFTRGGGTASRGQQVPIAVRVTDTYSREPVAGQRVVIRGWRHGKVVVKRWVTTNRNGAVTTRIRLRATTRFDLRSPATSTTRAATSIASIRWRVR